MTTYAFTCAVCHDEHHIWYPATPVPPVEGVLYAQDRRIYPCRYGGPCQFVCDGKVRTPTKEKA